MGNNIIALVILAAFYISYIAKMLLLQRQNIKGDVLGKGEKPKGQTALEIALKCVTYLGAAAQFASAPFGGKLWGFTARSAMQIAGIALMACGTATFVAAIVTMKSNWRAGYSEGQGTRLVTGGIYRWSRNPAFLGFDLLYIGCALAFPNVMNIAFALATLGLFHAQILGEEAFLARVFGDEYQVYRAKTLRYFGLRR